MAEDAIADGKARHLGTNLDDRAHRHVAERTWKALQPDVRRSWDVSAPSEVIRSVGDGIIAVADQLGAVLRRGELGLDPDLRRPERRILIVTDHRCPWRGRDQLARHTEHAPFVLTNGTVLRLV